MGRIEIYSFNLVYLRLYSLFHQTTPTSEEIGYCDEIKVSEIGGTSVTIFKQGKMLWLDVIFWLKSYLELLSTCPTVFGSLSSKVSQLQSAKFPRYNLFDFYFLIFFSLLLEREETAVSTVVIRGSTENIMDDIERAIDDGVNTFKALTRDDRFVPGAGATEIELAKQISSFGEVCWEQGGNSFQVYASFSDTYWKNLDLLCLFLGCCLFDCLVFSFTRFLFDELCFSICRSVCPFVCLYIYPLSVCLSFCLFFGLFFVSFCSSSICLRTWLSANLSVCLFVCWSVYWGLSICVFVGLSDDLFVRPSVCLSVCLLIYRKINILKERILGFFG